MPVVAYGYSMVHKLPPTGVEAAEAVVKHWSTVGNNKYPLIFPAFRTLAGLKVAVTVLKEPAGSLIKLAI
jgi:hypothetical protein